MVVNFHAQTGGTGPVTAIASASVEIGTSGLVSYSNGSKLGTVGTSGQLKSVAVVPNQTVTVGQTLTVEVQAEDAVGDVFPLTPGSVTLSFVGGGGTYAKFETNGDLLGLAVGSVTVSPQVDGVTGATGTINVAAAGFMPSRVLTQVTNAMVENPTTGTFWASIPSTTSPYANNVIEVNPSTGAVIHHIFVGSEPGPLDISDDGTMLYVGLNGESSVCPVDLATFTAGTPFPLTAASTKYETSPQIYDLRVQPGNANVIAVTTWDLNSTATDGPFIYDHGVARPSGLGLYDGSSLAWGNATTLYAGSVESDPSTIYQCAVSGNGATLSKQLSDNTATDSNLRRFGSLIYCTDGTLINGASGAVLGHFKVVMGNGDGDVAVSAANNLAIFAQPTGNATVTVQSFDSSTLGLVSTYTIPNLTDYGYGLRGIGIYNGTGLAFRTSGHIYFIDHFSGP
jgi:hypothetical protein